MDTAPRMRSKYYDTSSIIKDTAAKIFILPVILDICILYKLKCANCSCNCCLSYNYLDFFIIGHLWIFQIFMYYCIQSIRKKKKLLD